MVAEVRRGMSLRAVALQFGVSLSTIQYWVGRAAGQRLDRVDWSNRRPGCRTPANRVSVATEERVLRVRKHLRERSDLGECGPQAIREEMVRRRMASIPSARTIARILGRRGALDGRRRFRRPAPPRGWYLPDLAAREVELDSFDVIEDLVIAGGAEVNVLTGISLHGGLCAAWPETQITAKFTVGALLEHWREVGLPRYAKFDNDMVFHGSHGRPNSFGRVTRFCLSLGVTPVFAPPRETGFQADIESFNGRWQNGVWTRFRFVNVDHVARQSQKYVTAAREKLAARIQDAPARPPISKRWRLNLRRPLQGTVIFLRRTDDKGNVRLLGHTYPADREWCRRLVRAEVDLDRGQIRIYALRRREPNTHRLLRTHDYRPPRSVFHE